MSTGIRAEKGRQATVELFTAIQRVGQCLMFELLNTTAHVLVFELLVASVFLIGRIV